MSFEIIKALLLILLGGFITFIFNLLIGRLQRQQPRLVWRSFPSIHIAMENLSGISWLIENTGQKSAKNVRLRLSLPPNAKFNSFEIKSSEPALSYSHADDPEKPGSKIISIPIFTQGVSIGISSLIAGLGDNSATVSLVGEDVIGTEKDDMSEEAFEKRRRSFRLITDGAKVVVILLMLFFTCFVFYTANGVLEYEHTKMIADLYLKTKDYDTAIDLYKTYQENQLLNPVADLTNHQLSRIYALKGDKQKSILFLQQLPVKYFGKQIAKDSSFDGIRSSPEFQEYIKKR